MQQGTAATSTSSSPDISMVVRPTVAFSNTAAHEETPLDLTLRKSSEQFAEKKWIFMYFLFSKRNFKSVYGVYTACCFGSVPFGGHHHLAPTHRFGALSGMIRNHIIQ